MQVQQNMKHPALRYPGGKFKDRSWILSFFPSHVTYCEPYGGAGSVLLSKDISPYEFYNDLDGGVVNFFRVLRDRGEELIRKIELTPFSREEQEQSRILCENDLENARRFYVRSWQSVGALEARHNSGWRNMYQGNRFRSVVQDWNRIEHLWEIVDRLKQVQIENRPALELMKRVDTVDTLFYVDPPYVRSTRNARDLYAFEMSDEDHRILSKTIHSLKGMVILSGYQCDLYEELYGDFVVVKKETTKNFGRKAVESLWLSPSVANQQKQLNLFGGI